MAREQVRNGGSGEAEHGPFANRLPLSRRQQSGGEAAALVGGGGRQVHETGCGELQRTEVQQTFCQAKVRNDVVSMLDQQAVGRLIKGLIELGLKLDAGRAAKLAEKQLMHGGVIPRFSRQQARGCGRKHSRRKCGREVPVGLDRVGGRRLGLATDGGAPFPAKNSDRLVTIP
jgi:hypothetical protein